MASVLPLSIHVPVSEMLLGEGHGQCVNGGANPGDMCDSHCQCPSGKGVQYSTSLSIIHNVICMM